MTDEPRMTDGEVRDLAELLRRYARSELDQFENWRVKDAYGHQVYISMARAPAEGATDAAYTSLDDWLAEEARR